MISKEEAGNSLLPAKGQPDNAQQNLLPETGIPHLVSTGSPAARVSRLGLSGPDPIHFLPLCPATL